MFVFLRSTSGTSYHVIWNSQISRAILEKCQHRAWLAADLTKLKRPCDVCWTVSKLGFHRHQPLSLVSLQAGPLPFCLPPELKTECLGIDVSCLQPATTDICVEASVQ